MGLVLVGGLRRPSARGERGSRAPGSAGLRRKAMRTLCTLVLVLAVPAGFAAAEDKTAPIAPETTTAQLLLLRQKSVQKELKLSDEVAKKVMDFTNKESEEYGKALKLADKDRTGKFE